MTRTSQAAYYSRGIRHNSYNNAKHGYVGSLDGIRRMIGDKIGLTPVHFFSHGSTMMLGEKSESADYWRKTGEEALAHNIKGVIIMVSELMRIQLVTTTDRPGRTLGLSRRQDRGRNQPEPGQVARRLRPPGQIHQLQVEPRPRDGPPMH